mmetsp:Transcript_16465/g.23229  ORF Transcript_16465/g.23229 Transcript_16465/m.23229 type:complete len:188 (-) Transcript_16465:30-593(-)
MASFATDQSSMKTSKNGEMPFDSNNDSLSSIEQLPQHPNEKPESILRRSGGETSSTTRVEVDMANFSPFAPRHNVSPSDSDSDSDERTWRSSYSSVSFNNSATVIEFNPIKNSQQHKVWFQPDELRKFKKRAKDKIEKHARLNGIEVRTKGFYAHPALAMDPLSSKSADGKSPMKKMISQVRRKSMW